MDNFVIGNIRENMRLLQHNVQVISDSINNSSSSSSSSGSYSDLSNKPIIPTNNNQLTNGANYLTSVGINQLTGLTWSNVLDNEVIRRSGSTTAEGAGMKLRDEVTSAGAQNIYNKTISYFNRVSPTTIQFGGIDFQNTSLGYNQRIVPYNLLLETSGEGLYLHHSHLGNATNVSVGINVQYPTQEFQVGTTLYVDDTTGRVGIGIQNPEESLEVNGSIQIDSSTTARLKFQQSGASPHALCEIDGTLEGANGGSMEFYTKLVDGSLTKKLTISEKGAIGIGATPLYGNAGQFLRSGSSSAAPTWHTLTLDSLDDVLITLASGANVPANGELLAYASGQGWQNSSVLNSISTTSFFNINSPLQLQGLTGSAGQVLSVASSGFPEWTTPSAPNLSGYATLASPTFTTAVTLPNTVNFQNLRIVNSGNACVITSPHAQANSETHFGAGHAGAHGQTKVFFYGDVRINGDHHTLNNWSDDRIKSHEQILTGKTCIDYIKQIVPKKYKKYNTIITKEEEESFEAGGDPFKDKLNGNYANDSKYRKPTVEYGFIAQEIEKISGLQEIVTRGDTSNPYQLDYKCINTLLLGAVKDLIKRIETLESM